MNGPTSLWVWSQDRPGEDEGNWRLEWPDFDEQFESPLGEPVIDALRDLVSAVEFLTSKATLPPHVGLVVRIRAEERPSQLGLGLGSSPLPRR
jgi:hypothetical protein